MFTQCLNGHKQKTSIAAIRVGLCKLEALSVSLQHLSGSVVLSTCLRGLPCCSGDYGIITEIYIVLEEIGGLSPGVMFKGPSLH